MALGLTGLDFAADIRDLTYDLTNWEWTPEHIGGTLLDAIGLLPVFGSLKFADELGAVAKNGIKSLDEVSDTMKATDKALDGAEDIAKAGKVISGIKYKPSSGAVLKANPNKTTTIIGSFDKDMKNIIDEMGNVKSTDFGAKNGGFNVLNVPDEMYKDADQFWNEINKPWLDEAIKRGDDIVLATKPEGIVLSYVDRITGEEVVTGFGREYNYLIKRGYDYDAVTNIMKKR